MLGDLNEIDDLGSDVDTYWVLYIFFLATTLILYITMLNLLIAIINDTFNKVKALENRTKTWERWNIITEIDIMRSDIYNQNRQKKKYLIKIYNENTEDNDLFIEKNFKEDMNEITNKIITILKEQEIMKEEIKQIPNKIKAILKETE